MHMCTKPPSALYVYRWLCWHPYTCKHISISFPTGSDWCFTNLLYRGGFIALLGTTHIQRGIYTHTYILVFFPKYMGDASQSPYTEWGFMEILDVKPLYTGDFVRHLGAWQSHYKERASHTYTCKHILVFLQIWGVLHKVPIQRRICKAPWSLVNTNIYTNTHFNLFPTDMEGMFSIRVKYQKCFCQELH